MAQCKGLQIPKAVSSNLTLTSRSVWYNGITAVSKTADRGSIPWTGAMFRSVAQPGSAPALGAGGPRFESLYSDQNWSRSINGDAVDCKSAVLDMPGSIPGYSTNK